MAKPASPNPKELAHYAVSNPVAKGRYFAVLVERFDSTKPAFAGRKQPEAPVSCAHTRANEKYQRVPRVCAGATHYRAFATEERSVLHRETFNTLSSGKTVQSLNAHLATPLFEALGNVAALRQNRVVSCVLNFIKNFALESISIIVRLVSASRADAFRF